MASSSRFPPFPAAQLVRAFRAAPVAEGSLELCSFSSLAFWEEGEGRGEGREREGGREDGGKGGGEREGRGEGREREEGRGEGGKETCRKKEKEQRRLHITYCTLSCSIET